METCQSKLEKYVKVHNRSLNVWLRCVNTSTREASCHVKPTVTSFCFLKYFHSNIDLPASLLALSSCSGIPTVLLLGFWQVTLVDLSKTLPSKDIKFENFWKLHGKFPKTSPVFMENGANAQKLLDGKSLQRKLLLTWTWFLEWILSSLFSSCCCPPRLLPVATRLRCTVTSLHFTSPH